jgi:membrane-associated phospholipid phosphatase
MLRQRFIAYYRAIRASLTLGVVVLSGCLLLLALFGWLSGEVLEREAFGFDTTILLWLHRHSNTTIDRVMLSITKLGDPNFVIPLVAIVFGILVWRKRMWTAQILVLTCLGAGILNQGLKLVFVKPRPQLWTPLIVENTFSYPSGHALGSAVLYGFLAILLVRQYPQYRSVIYLTTLLLVGAIGLSRLFLCVHYPTDIIAGYAVGIPWLATCVKILQIGAHRELENR